MIHPRKTAFVLIAADHGSMIVSRLDYQQDPDHKDRAWGIGIELLELGAYQRDEIECSRGLLELRRRYFGDGVIAIDGGANIGVHTIEWAKLMTGWGQVVAFEAQERVFYALAGNIALNNCFNACAIQAALSDKVGVMEMPVPDYLQPASLGGLELRKIPWTYGIGQKTVDVAPVRTDAIDRLGLDRCDLLKLDIEGMEMEALAGAEGTILECHPILHIEHIKIGADEHAGVPILSEYMAARDYIPFRFGGNLIGVHRLDKCLDHVKALHMSLLQAQARVQREVEWQNMRPSDWEQPNKEVEVVA